MALILTIKILGREQSRVGYLPC